MSKYTDLAEQIHAGTRDVVYLDEVREVLRWLDDHPELTGRTITRSHYQNIIDETSVPYGVGFTDGFHQAGGSIIDDPEPTNLQRLSRAIRDWEQGRGADGILARHLDAIGVRMVTESE